jgi:hypothetical protein
MNPTLDEIATHRARLREEIMERECLLAALEIFEKYAASGHIPQSMQLGSLVSKFVPSRPADLKELPSSHAPPPAPVALPPKPPVERYIHPELKHWSFQGHGANTNLVRWAIQRMTGDYSLHDIAALLEREGRGLFPADISVVLTRLKRRGEIEEITRSAGPKPAVFRTPERPTSLATAPEGSVANTEATATPVTVS